MVVCDVYCKVVDFVVNYLKFKLDDVVGWVLLGLYWVMFGDGVVVCELVGCVELLIGDFGEVVLINVEMLVVFGDLV